MTGQEAPRALRIHIGQSLAEIARDQPVDIRPAKLLDNSPVVIDDVITLTYDEPGLAFTMPPSRYLWLGQLAGLVHSIKTTPQLRFLALPEAWALGRTLVTQLEVGSEWQPVEIPVSTLADVQAMAASAESKDEFRLWMGEWRRGSRTLELFLQRQVRAGRGRDLARSADTDLYLVNLVIADREIERALREQVIEKRLEIAGNPSEALPLTVWLKERR